MSTHDAQAQRHQARLIVHTGIGKGKSTAAFGLGLRGWAQGWSIGVFQFVKSAKWHTGEQQAYTALNRVHEHTGEGGEIEWQTLGQGWTWLRANRDTDQATLARQGWKQVCTQLIEQRHDLYILDEFAHVLSRGWVSVDEAIATLTARPGHQHVVITGRDCPQPIIAAADLVTEMTKIKHPFDAGERGQAGIEW